MELTSERRIAAPPERVWQALTDPDVLRRLIPGCQRLERSAEREYVLELGAPTLAAGQLYAARVHVLQEDAPRTLRVAFEGESRQGAPGSGGFASGEAAATLAAIDGATMLRSTIDAHAGGAMASAWSGSEHARRLFDGFLDALVSEIGVAPSRELGAEGPAGVIAAALSPTPASAAPPAAGVPSAAARPGDAAAQGMGNGMLAGLLAAIPAEPFGFPRVAWIGGFLFVCIFLLIFSAYV